MLLENKNAVIFGAGGGIGGAVARAFAREGAEAGKPSNMVPIRKHGENTENRESAAGEGSAQFLEELVRPPRFERGTFSSGG
jgi:NAD(P)-dependent dehydrogenase (short-subunit alcohol dehydrogenase family)